MRIILLATFIAFGVFMFLGDSPVYAERGKSCNFDEQLGIIYHEADIARGRLAEQQLEIINQIEVIANKCKDEDKPVREQLSHDDNAKFMTLMQRRNVMHLGSLLESRRMRDMQVFRKFAILAEKEVRWPEIPAESHPDFIYYVMLASTRQVFDGKIQRTTPTTELCNIEASIHVIEQETIDKISGMAVEPLQELQKFTDRMIKKYRVKKLDFEKMSKADQKELSDLSKKAQPYFRLMDLVNDYEIIKLLVRTSQLIYESDKNDIVTYGGDFESVGKTLMEKANSGIYGEQTKKAYAILRVIDKKIPCDDINQGEAMLKKMDKSGKR